MRVLLLLGALCWAHSALAQEHSEHEHRKASPRKQGQAIEELKMAVNGPSRVTTECPQNGQTTTIEESTQITAIHGCEATFETTKTTRSDGNEQQLKFVLHVDFASLTTPSSVVSKTFSACKPKNGEVLKLISPVQPGKRLRVTRQEILKPDTKTGQDPPSTETMRNDLSLFFSDASAARKAAQALDKAIQACGGEEWPDEDDLP